MYLRITLTVAAVAAAALLSGCYEAPDVTRHEPGVYKGPEDPLLALQRSADQRERLRDRFDLVQTDR